MTQHLEKQFVAFKKNSPSSTIVGDRLRDFVSAMLSVLVDKERA